MDTGGRGRPLRRRSRGLSCVALIGVVLGLWLGVGAGRPLIADHHALPTVSRTVGAAQALARPSLPDPEAVAVDAVVFVLGTWVLLLSARRPVRPVRAPRERPRGRAPPGAGLDR